MKQIFSSIITIIVIMITSCGQSFAQGSHSGQSLNNSFAASNHASKSIAHSVAASGQVVSGVVSIPLISAGALGAASAQAGDALWEAATAPANGPLKISNETVTAGPPPDEAVLKQDI